MNRRVSFNSKDIRNLFFKKCFESMKFNNWNQLVNFLGASRSILSNYRNGKLTFPEYFYDKLATSLSKADKEFFSKNISFLENGWGRIKAGKTTYSKYKQIFDNGRIKAIDSVRARAHKVDINIPLNTELAYLIGLFIGDGFANKYNRYYLIQFIGDKKEQKFYQTLVSDYFKKVFNIVPKIKDDKFCNAIRVNLYSFELFNLITKRFHIPAGRKSRKVLIPDEIMNSETSIIKSCIRGLYDAEGCVFFDKRKQYPRPYPKIDLHMNNLNLLKQVYTLLNKVGIKCNLGTFKNNLRISIYGEEAVKKFVHEIGFFNPKHLKKLEVL